MSPDYRHLLRPETQRLLDDGVDFELRLTLEDGSTAFARYHSDSFVPPSFIRHDDVWWAVSTFLYGRGLNAEGAEIEARLATPEEVADWIVSSGS